MADSFTTNQVQGQLGEFRPVLDESLPFTTNNVQGIWGEFVPVLDEVARSPYVPTLVFGNHLSDQEPRVDGAAGVPAHTGLIRTLYWDTTNNKLYVNNDGSTGWTAVN